MPEPITAGTVHSERQGRVAVLTLSYPERRNALSMPLRAALATALQQAMEDAQVRVVVLTGEGGHFCSGGDISSFGGVTPTSGRWRMQQVHHIVRLLLRGEKPVIAAVEGHAAGAGLCIAAACDMVVASQTARFSCTFNKIGLLPDLGGAWSLPLRMGLGRAKMLMMSGRVLDADAASAQGLVDQVAAPGQALQAALELARDVAANSAPLSNGMVKSLLARSNAFGYGEIQEGGRRSPSTLMSAFGQIRDPQFIGVTITKKEDVYPALKSFFSTRDEPGLAAVAR